MGNRDDIEQMSGSNGVVLTSALKLIDKYDLYGQVAYPKHHKQSDVPEIYRLAAKTKVLFICIFSILKSIRFFISRFYKFLQSHIKCFMKLSTSLNFTYSYQFTATLQKCTFLQMSIHHPPTNFFVKMGHVFCRVCLSTLLWWSHLV
jgi:hypothetical protein